ncbi:DMT superfamily drug/metabolite transporter [Mannheimia varigena USDA-ARS-USMARC-1388]|uniref:DMT family transporter n=1 Tax=Mannheimia varigena TaxID=85404 RepID=UPI0003E355F0|nr:EamA family transporter [Mannheimia varigena]AHG80594.1 DMT superfamily drug/metabolite transporter [Mannheimia varigena USDA-ARS-USMARC-1388]
MLYLLTATLIWASSFIVGKVAIAEFDPVQIMQIRLTLAAFIALPFFMRAYRKIQKNQQIKVWLIAFLIFPLCVILQFSGLKLTSAASAVALLGLNPLLTVLVGYFCFNKQATRLDFILSLFACVGILIMAAGSDDNGSINVLGLLLVTLGSLSFIIGMYLSKGILQSVKVTDLTNITLVQGAITALPITLLFAEDWQLPTSLSAWASVAYLGIICSSLAMLLWNKGISQSSPILAGILLALEPVFGLLMALVFLSEQLSLITWVGIIIVICTALLSVFLPMMKRYKRSF